MLSHLACPTLSSELGSQKLFLLDFAMAIRKVAKIEMSVPREKGEGGRRAVGHQSVEALGYAGRKQHLVITDALDML